MYGRRRSQCLKFTLKSASAVPRCHSHQCTLMIWVSDVMILTSSMLSSLTSCVPLLPYLARFTEHGWTQTSSTELQDFTETNIALWTMIRDFLEKSIGVHFFQFKLSSVRPVILQPWKKPSSIPCSKGRDLKVLNLPSNLHRQSPVVAATTVP